MKRHSLNVFSLVFGVILILLATWIAFPARGWLFGIPEWFLPGAVILVGAALMSPLFTSKENKRRGPEETGHVDQPWDVSKTPAGESSSPDWLTDGQDGTS